MEESYKTEEPQSGRDAREIPARVSRMEAALADLYESIDTLAHSLGSVLRDAKPSADVASPREAPETELGRALDAHVVSVEGAAFRLRELRDRAEL